MAEKERISYFDTMKGIAIILVIVHHALGYNGTTIELMLESLRMPIFIFVAGIFLSFRRGFKILTIKKINRYILPLILFSVLYAIFHDLFLANITLTHIKTRIYNYCINLSLSNANEPLWFLKMLFFLCIITYCIEKALPQKSRILKLAIVIAVSTAFAYLILHFDPQRHCGPISIKVFNSQIPSAMYMLPIYYFAYLYKDFFLNPPSKKFLLLALPVALIVWYLCAKGPILYYLAYSNLPYPLLLLAQVSSVYCCFAVAYALGRIPIVSYLGQYSLVILGTHSIVQILLVYVLNIESKIIVMLVMLISAPALIYIFTRYLPHFTAQKDLIKVTDDGKIRISFSN